MFHTHFSITYICSKEFNIKSEVKEIVIKLNYFKKFSIYIILSECTL